MGIGGTRLRHPIRRPDKTRPHSDYMRRRMTPWSFLSFYLGTQCRGRTPSRLKHVISSIFRLFGYHQRFGSSKISATWSSGRATVYASMDSIQILSQSSWRLTQHLDWIHRCFYGRSSGRSLPPRRHQNLCRGFGGAWVEKIGESVFQYWQVSLHRRKLFRNRVGISI